MEFLFEDRRDAGEQLARKLEAWANRDDVFVLALPRGGVPIGVEVARALHAPLDVFVVRKLGVPEYEEMAMGAIASGNVLVLDENLIAGLGISRVALQEVMEREERELARRERLYRGVRGAPVVKGRTVILVDDGLATGSTMAAATEALRKQEAMAIVVAVPVAPPATCQAFREGVTDMVCLFTPEPFHAVGYWYEDFEQVSDDEVRSLLEQAAQAHALTG